MFIIWYQVRNKLRVTVEHRPGIQMLDIDDISRNRPHTLPPALEVTPQSLPDLDKLFENCNVLLQRNLEDHRTVMKRVIRDVERFSS